MAHRTGSRRMLLPWEVGLPRQSQYRSMDPLQGASGSKRPVELDADIPSTKRPCREVPTPNLVRPSPMAKVHVRKNDETEYTTFPVHLNHICHYSPFFFAAFRGRFKEGEQKEMHLEEVEPEVFGIMMNWLYTQQIQDEHGALPSCAKLVNLWIFADRVLIPRLQNHALLALDQARIQAKKLTSSLYQSIYDGTTAESPLRQYLIDYCVNSTIEIITPQAYPSQLLVDIVNATRKAKRPPTGRKTCRWNITQEELDGYLVDEDTDHNTDQRYELSDDIETRNAEEQSALEASMLEDAEKDVPQDETAADDSHGEVTDATIYIMNGKRVVWGDV